MTASTPVYAFPYPEDLDPPNGPDQIGALALAVEGKFVSVDAALAAAVAAEITAWRPKYLRKGADQSKTNSTLVDDAVFTAQAYGAGQTWEVTLDLDYTGQSATLTGQLKTTFVVTGGLTIDRMFVTGMSDDAADVPDSTSFMHHSGRTAAGTIQFGTNASATFHNYARMTFTVTTTTAGTWGLQWAQVTTSATPTSILESSRMIARRLA